MFSFILYYSINKDNHFAYLFTNCKKNTSQWETAEMHYTYIYTFTSWFKWCDVKHTLKVLVNKTVKADMFLPWK